MEKRIRGNTGNDDFDGGMFPLPAATFVGRERQLERAVRMIAQETLHFVYGVAGIGKTEFVFKWLERVSLHLPAVMVTLRDGDNSESALTRISTAIGIRRAKASLATSGDVDLQAEAAAIAKRLEDEPQILFIDNAHHVDANDVSRLLGFLARRLRASRVIVATRAEVVLPERAPQAAIHRLDPLSSEETTTLVAALAERRGQAAPDSSKVFAQSGGSPFFVIRSVVGAGSESGLESTVAQLSNDARNLLTIIAVGNGELRASDVERAALTAALAELSSKFLVDEARLQLITHDLVRDQVMQRADSQQLRLAHRNVAEWLQLRGEHLQPLELVAIVQHLVSADDLDDGWEFASQHYRTIAAAGLDHLVVDGLEQIALRLPASGDFRIEDVQLLIARILIRRSHITEAAELLRVIGDRGDAASLRWLLLAGEVAQRRGKLRDAEGYFRRAFDRAEAPGGKLHAAFARADVFSLAGDSTAARDVLAAVKASLQLASGNPAARAKARWGWSLALSYLMEQRFLEGATAAEQATAALGEGSSDDLAALLAMLEILARSELDQIDRARAVLARTEALAMASGALRSQVLAGYEGVLEYHSGNLELAARLLDSSYDHLAGHSDQILAVLAGYYRARCFLTQGDSEQAGQLAARLAKMASAAELQTLAPHGRAMHAEALLLAGRVEEASLLANAALDSPRVCQQVYLLAHSVLAEIAALDGDLPVAKQQLAKSQMFPQQASTDLTGVDYSLQQAVQDGDRQLTLAWIELLGGDTEVAMTSAATAAQYYASTRRHALLSRANALRSLALAARGNSRDIAEAEVLLAAASESASRSGDRRTVALCALGKASLALTRGLDPAQFLGEQPGELLHIEGRAVRAARGQIVPPPGIRSLLSKLRLVVGARHRVVSRTAVRMVSDGELVAIRSGHRLVVEPTRAVITARCGDDVRVDRGRPLACELLAVLLETQGAVIAAEQLFLAVWGVREYHPLRHRNTLYVAVKRLRTTLRDLLGEDKEWIETAAGGWRIIDELDGITIRPEAPAA